MANNLALVPLPGTKGKFTLKAPFDAQIQNVIYELISVREFKDCENKGEVILDTYYSPFGLTQTNVDTDRANGEAILTLLNSAYSPLYVPSSYVASYPDVSSKPYNQVVLSLSLGALPDTVVLDSTIDAIKNACSDFLGVEPTVYTGLVALTDVVSAVDNENREAARQAAIANRTTDYARLAAEQAANAALQQQVTVLTQILKANNLLPS